MSQKAFGVIHPRVLEPLILLFRPQWGLCISVYTVSILFYSLFSKGFYYYY